MQAIKIINLVAIVIVGLFLLFGAGYAIPAIFLSGFFQIAMLGYLLALIFGILAFRKNYFLWLSLVGWLIFGLANIADSKTASNDNADLCAELRADPACVEDECGFDCPDIVTSGSICKDKDMSLCREKVMNIKPALDEKGLRDAVFSAVESTLKNKYEGTKDSGYATWDKIINITGIDPTQKAAQGKWRAKDAWDWIAWQEDNGDWKVLVSFDGFNCEELDSVPNRYGAFFKDITFPSRKKYCY